MGSFPEMYDPLLLSLQRWRSQSNHFSFSVVLPPSPQKRTPDHRLLFCRTVFPSRFPPISMWKTVSDRKQCPLIGDGKMMSFMVWPVKKKQQRNKFYIVNEARKANLCFSFIFMVTA